jgi:hypothetical protein
MLRSLKTKLSRNYINSLGWKTNRKIIVIESDDWGSIRMRDKKTYDYLLNKGIRVDLCPYNRYDSIASEFDLFALYETLEKFRDVNNRTPVITFNTNTANPDFGEIQKSCFENYYYKPFTKTIKEYYPNKDVFSVWKEGMSNGYIFPQYHHREHVNTDMWLDLLRKDNRPLKLAFEKEIFGLSFITSDEIKVPFLGSLIYTNKKEFENISSAIIEGGEIFEDIFNFKSKSMIAPLYSWSKSLEKSMHSSGIEYLQGGNIQKSYDFSLQNRQRIINSFGSLNKYGQVYLNRNCTFEPSIQQNKFNMKKILEEINSAFFWKKPAVLSSHRLNYIGSIDEKNRSKNLRHLTELLSAIQKKWPNVEFMHSSELGDTIKNSYAK